MKMPRTKPRTIAGIARRSVPPVKPPRPRSPWTTRKAKLLTMTERSSTGSPAARDEAGDREAALDAGHDRRDPDTEHQVDDGARRERLDRSRRVGLDLAGLEGELRHANRERDRRVLEQVERLARRGRHDEPERDRQDDKPVGLERREPHRHGGLELGLRDRLDARANDLRHAGAVVDAEREHSGPELGSVVEEPLPGHLREERRNPEIPEEHPDEQRDVAEELDVERRHGAQRLPRDRAEGARQDPEAHGEEPREARDRERRAEALEQPAPRLAAPEHLPVEVVVQRGSGLLWHHLHDQEALVLRRQRIGGLAVRPEPLVVEPCWAATRLPAIDSIPLIGLFFFTRNCAPVTKKVRLKSTDSRRARVSVIVPAMRSTAFDDSKGMRVGGVDSFFSIVMGLPSFRSIAGLTACSTRSIEKPTHSFCLLTNANGGDAVRVPIVSTPL